MVSELADVRRRLEAAGVEDAAFDAAQLYLLATGRDARLACGAPLTAQERQRLDALCEKRCARYPLQYLCGTWDFLDLTLKVGPGVLIPRADTETVAEAAIEAARAAGPGAAVADLCSGTGAIALGVATHVPSARVTAVELSREALAYLEANNAAYGSPLRVVCADVMHWQDDCAPAGFDVIVSNPPYIAPDEMPALAPELSHEPRMALEAADGGLAFYRHIAPAYFGALRPGGWLIFETGSTQTQAVAALCRAAGYADVSVRADAAGNPRCVLARRPIAF